MIHNATRPLTTLFLAAGLVAGCSGDKSSDTTTDSAPVDSGTAVDDTDDSDDPPDGGVTTTEEPGTDGVFMREADCYGPPPPAGDVETYFWNGPHEDFTFNTDGEIVGANAQALLTHTPFGGPAELIQPLPSGGLDVKGTRYLPDGSLLLATVDLGALTRIYPDGTEEIVGSGVPVPNGIAIHPAGWAYIAAGNGIWRFDANTGETVRLIETEYTLDGISFSPDYSQLFFNTEFRRVWVSNVIDDEGNLSPAYLGPEIDLPFFDILDGMATDACGNLYVLAMSGTIFRIRTDQTVEEFIDIPNTVAITTPALNFGTGVGGFEKDHLYVMDFRGRLHDVPVGIAGKWEPHLPRD